MPGLNGRIVLTARQTAQIVGELGDGPTNPIDIAVAITKATNRGPTETQTRTVTETLTPNATQQ